VVERRAGRWVAPTLLIPLLVILALAGYWLLFTTFMVYDDEGYVLISLRNYAETGGLYGRVYTQYGPFPYVLYDGLARVIGFAFNNTSGRWITLINWLVTAIACASLVGRITRSCIWTALTLTGTFVYLWIMINEPIHPGGLVIVVVALATWIAAEAWIAQRLVLFGIVTGTTAASLALTKINVGVFFAGATCSWLALQSAPAARARLLTWVAAISCTVLPLALMKALLDAQWVGIFALVFATGSLGIIFASRVVAKPFDTGKVWVAFFAAFAATLILICAVPLLRGTSLHGLFDGVIREPLKHPGVYSFPMRWQSGSALVALASLALALGFSQPRWNYSETFKECLAWVRVGVASLFWCTSLGIASTSMSQWGLSYGVSLAWLFVLPLRADSAAGPARSWVALMLVFQSLQAYPVAGSQLSWGTYLWIALVALGLHDAAPHIARRIRRWERTVTWVARAGLTCMALYMAANLAKIGWNRYSQSQRLELPGAEDIRVPNDLTYALRIASENLGAHADVLFTFPGMYSTNIWTGLRTPTLANATHWFSLLSQERQQAIIDELANSPRAAIFVQQQLVDYLARHGFPPHGLLYEWISKHFESRLAFGAYEIWVQRGRTIAPLSTARVNRSKDGAVQSLTLTMRAPRSPIEQVQTVDRTMWLGWAILRARTIGSISGEFHRSRTGDGTVHTIGQNPLLVETLGRFTRRGKRGRRGVDPQAVMALSPFQHATAFFVQRGPSVTSGTRDQS
jgi:hypothetical protein